MTEREKIGGLSAWGARALGFDVPCQCGHDYGLHQAPGTECVVIDCQCGHFRARGEQERPKEG